METTPQPGTDDSNDVEEFPFPVRKMDTASLKALAHPLRVQILEMLSRYGAQTACGLGELLGESSGSTSYHLRQLAKHDFVREVEGKGTARERWWERPRGALQVSSPELASSPATEEASRLVSREFEHSRQAVLADFMAHGLDALDGPWLHAATINTSNARLNAEQLGRYTRAMEAYGHRLMEEIRTKASRKTPGRSRSISMPSRSLAFRPRQRAAARAKQRKRTSTKKNKSRKERAMSALSVSRSVPGSAYRRASFIEAAAARVGSGLVAWAESRRARPEGAIGNCEAPPCAETNSTCSVPTCWAPPTPGCRHGAESPAGQPRLVLFRQRAVVALDVVEHEGGFGVAHHRVGGQVVQDPVPQVLGGGDGDVQQVVHRAGRVERGQHGRQLGHAGSKAVDLLAVMGAEPDCDQGLDRAADGRQAQFGFKALDDAPLGERAGAHQRGGGGDAHQFGQLLVGDPGVVDQGGQQPFIDGVQRLEVSRSRPNILRMLLTDPP